MKTLAVMRSELADACEGVGTPALTAFDYAPSDIPATPCAVVEVEEGDFEGPPATFQRGSEEWTLSVFVLVNPADAAQAARLTDQFFDRSANDLKDAIEAAGDGYAVSTADRFGEYQIAGRAFHGFRYVVKALN